MSRPQLAPHPPVPRQPVPSPAKDAVVSMLRDLSGELALLGVTRIALFGSVARGEDGPESDIDIAVATVDPGDWMILVDVREIVERHPRADSRRGRPATPVPVVRGCGLRSSRSGLDAAPRPVPVPQGASARINRHTDAVPRNGLRGVRVRGLAERPCGAGRTVGRGGQHASRKRTCKQGDGAGNPTGVRHERRGLGVRPSATRRISDGCRFPAAVRRPWRSAQSPRPLPSSAADPPPSQWPPPDDPPWPNRTASPQCGAAAAAHAPCPG